MKLMLIRPPLEFGQDWDVAAQAEIPLALMYLGAACRRAGHHVVLLDAAVQAEPSDLAFNDAGILHVGASWEEVARAVREAAPDVVGINSAFYTQMPQALHTARVVRSVLENVPILVGGPPVTVRPEDYLAEPAVTVAALGEAGVTLPQLLERFAGGQTLDGIPGIAYRRDGRMTVNERIGFLEDLDALPDPAYDLVDLERYMRTASMDTAGHWRWRPLRTMTVLTSRGCPFHCMYCAVHCHMGRKYRMQSAERALGHIRFIATELGIRELHFIDDNMNQNRDRFNAIPSSAPPRRATGWA